MGAHEPARPFQLLQGETGTVVPQRCHPFLMHQSGPFGPEQAS
jgi:hypothetical protein